MLSSSGLNITGIGLQQHEFRWHAFPYSKGAERLRPWPPCAARLTGATRAGPQSFAYYSEHLDFVKKIAYYIFIFKPYGNATR
jgi:hypothetical protein